MIRRPPRSTRTDTLFPYTTLFRSIGNASRRMQHENLDTVAVPAGFDGRRAGIAGGRPDNCHLFAARPQKMIEKPPEKLQGHILEGQRRAVMKLHQPVAAADLAERRDRLVTEALIGGFDKLPQLIDRK